MVVVIWGGDYWVEVFVWIVHEVVLVAILILNRVPKKLILDDVLFAHGPIFLLLHDHFLVHLSSCVIVRHLWFKLNNRSLLCSHQFAIIFDATASN